MATPFDFLKAEFPAVLRAARVEARLTLAELGERAGVARPNVTAYESGRREPLFDSALELLVARGANVSIDSPTVWRWNEGRRRYAVPSALWRLSPDVALGVFPSRRSTCGGAGQRARYWQCWIGLRAATSPTCGHEIVRAIGQLARLDDQELPCAPEARNAEREWFMRWRSDLSST